MPASTPFNRIGQIAGAGNVDALWLKKFSGEVIMEFDRQHVFKGATDVRTIQSGKSYQWPRFGRASAGYYTTGDNILDNSNGYLANIEKGETIITLDKTYLGAITVDEIEEMIAHYEVRSRYAEELGYQLAEQMDTQISRVLTKASTIAAGAYYTDSPGGTVLNKGATVATDGDTLLNALFEAARELDKKNVPRRNRFAAIAPDQEYILKTGTTNYAVLNRDYGQSTNLSELGLPRIAGFNIIVSNNMPNGTNFTATDHQRANWGVTNDYAVDATNTVALCWQSGALGTVKLQDLSFEQERKIEYQVHLMLAKYVCGHGILRPEAVVQISSAS